VRAPGITAADVGGARWALPGLTVDVTAAAAVTEVEAVADDVVVVRYEALPGTARWRLAVVDREWPAG
jgi:hypothetical protein